MTKDETKQAIEGFAQFFRAITGDQELEIPKDIKERLDIQDSCDKNTSKKEGRMTNKIFYNNVPIVSELFDSNRDFYIKAEVYDGDLLIPLILFDDTRGETSSYFRISGELIRQIINKHIGKENE